MTYRMALSLSALLTAAACSGTDATGPTTPLSASDVSTTASRSDESSRRRGALHVTKECSEYGGLPGQHCTITSSSLELIERGSTVTYAKGVVAGYLDTDVVLRTPGRGRNAAFGHCALSLVTYVGKCTFSGGTGKFRHFRAAVDVTALTRPNFAWEGWYSFRK
jgi:hypothetical protein